MYTDQITPRINFTQLLLYERPKAAAWITGNAAHPTLSGLVKFYQTNYGGVLVEAEIFGLPNIDTQGSSNFYAFHIHEFGDCSGDFQKAGGHYNPQALCIRIMLVICRLFWAIRAMPGLPFTTNVLPSMK